VTGRKFHGGRIGCERVDELRYGLLASEWRDRRTSDE
jgi:hypothetical protein